MAYFRIKQPDQPTKYIKSMDGANGTLEFTDNVREAMYRDMGFFADSDFEFIKFHFTKDYPELENMDIYDGYSDEDKCEEAVGAPIGGGWLAGEEAVAPGDLAVEAAVGEWDAVAVAAPAAPIYVANDNEFAAAYNGIGVADVAAP
jgi:hypothetical protein